MNETNNIALSFIHIPLNRKYNSQAQDAQNCHKSKGAFNSGKENPKNNFYLHIPCIMLLLKLHYICISDNCQFGQLNYKLDNGIVGQHGNII